MQKRADKRQHHYIYKVTRDDGKFYIGMHSTDNLDDGYFGSGQRISRSIKKHGLARHSKEILEFLPSREALKLREKELITEDMRANVLCMNIAPGGGGGFNDDDHRLKAQHAGLKAQWNDEAYREKHAKKSSERLKRTHAEGKIKYNNFAGRKHSEETLAKMRATYRRNAKKKSMAG